MPIKVNLASPEEAWRKDRPCETCGTPIVRKKWDIKKRWILRKYCSMRCNPLVWRGGRRMHNFGYVLIKVDISHHLNIGNGYALEHRMVVEKMLGRKLRKKEWVHHKNGIKSDNRPCNLEALTPAQHAEKHREYDIGLKRTSQRNYKIKCRCGCGATTNKFDHRGRPVIYLHGHNLHPHDSSKKR